MSCHGKQQPPTMATDSLPIKMVASAELGKPPSPRPPSPKLPPPPPPVSQDTAVPFWEPEKERDYLALPKTPPAAPVPPPTPLAGASTPNVATPTPTPRNTPTAFAPEPAVEKKKIPAVPKPGERLLCVDSKSAVVIANTVMLIYAIFYLAWNVIMKSYIFAGIAGGILILCLIIFENMFLTKSPACYIVIGTTLTIVVLVNYTLMGINYYKFLGVYNSVQANPAEVSNSTTPTTGKPDFELPPPPAVEGILIAFILIIGLIQLYRLQVFNDALRFAERNSIRRLRNSIKSLVKPKAIPVEP